MDEPTDEMWRALINFRARHGRRWKETLSIKWMNGSDEHEHYSSSLRMVRNHFGPSWLCDLKKATLDAAILRLARQDVLPEMCGTTLASTDEPIVIIRGESGYTPMPDGMTVEIINATFKVTAAQIAAMEAGSMFGWDLPGADPARYDACGKPLRS